MTLSCHLPRYVRKGAGPVSVASQLGLTDLDRGLVEARSLWAEWVPLDPGLAAVPGVDGLRDWLFAAEPAAADDVLLSLVRLGSRSGGDYAAAVWLTVWALLPGADAMARRMGGGADTEALIASQLWLEVRCFPWQRLQKVAGNVMANVRGCVLRRDGCLTRLSSMERITVPTDRLPELPELPATVSAAEELLEVLDWARGRGVITADDAALLLSMVAAQTELGDGRAARRGSQGLMSAAVLTATAERWGVSPSTVRRHARRSINAIAAAGRTKCPAAA